MLARVTSGTLVGVEAVPVDIEVDMSLGLPFFNVVGLADGAGRESRVRVLSALKNAGFELPQKRITVNLAPAELRKDGAAFELPIALGVLCAAGLLEPELLAGCLFAGELSLDGALKPIRGALPLAVAARRLGLRSAMVPLGSAPEAALAEGVEVFAVSNLAQAVAHLTGDALLSPFSRSIAPVAAPPARAPPDMSDVRGHDDVKLYLEVAAAGGHNVLLCGPPGSGKTLMARRLPGILPSLNHQEALEVTQVHSVLRPGTGPAALMRERPFRSPHHSLSDAGLVGGGPLLRPGELSLAHHGVLFLDELPEFRPGVLELLRQPLEEGVIHLARAVQTVTYPARVMLIAAMNPCPCGYYNFKTQRACSCGGQKVREYLTRVSGPILDRIDISLQTAPLDFGQLSSTQKAESSARIRGRVEEARLRQRHRFHGEPGVHCNAQMTPSLMERHCRLSISCSAVLESALRRFGLSARAYDRVIRLSRTLADLEGREAIAEQDVHVAVNGRALDRPEWQPGLAPQRNGYLATLTDGGASARGGLVGKSPAGNSGTG